jgi:hypothetical protein
MFALDVAFDTSWIDGKLTSLAYDDLTFSVMYKQLLEYVHYVVLCVIIHVCHARTKHKKTVATFTSLVANQTL